VLSSARVLRSGDESGSVACVVLGLHGVGMLTVSVLGLGGQSQILVWDGTGADRRLELGIGLYRFETPGRRVFLDWLCRVWCLG